MVYTEKTPESHLLEFSTFWSSSLAIFIAFLSNSVTSQYGFDDESSFFAFSGVIVSISFLMPSATS
jgi:hypothetical protein